MSTIEPKPCPFCGASASNISVSHVHLYEGEEIGEVICNICNTQIFTSSFATPEQAENDAIGMWNTRAELIERTCDMELLPYSEDDVSHRWTRERCSSCGSIFESDNFEAHGFGNFDFKFCPSCGAKVVSE